MAIPVLLSEEIQNLLIQLMNDKSKGMTMGKRTAKGLNAGVTRRQNNRFYVIQPRT